MQVLYCWRCRCKLPMLDEREYALFVNEAFLKPSELSVGRTPQEGYAISQEAHHKALDLYFRMTGLRETNINAENPAEDRPGRRGSRVALGQTAAGRFLRVIYVPDPWPDSVFVITAYDLVGKPLLAFRRRRRKKGKR